MNLSVISVCISSPRVAPENELLVSPDAILENISAKSLNMNDESPKPNPEAASKPEVSNPLLAPCPPTSSLATPV